MSVRTAGTVERSRQLRVPVGDQTTDVLPLIERLAYEHGESYDSYLILDPGREHFLSSDSSGVIGFTRWHQHAYVVGGLVAPEESKDRLLDEFLSHCRQERLKPLFFNVLKNDLDRFADRGLQVSKVGEEPLIDLRQKTWSGRKHEWVRRQENACLRSGVSVREVTPNTTCHTYRDRIVPQLLDVSQLHVEDTVFGRELALMVGRFQPFSMNRKRLFIAETGDRIEAFVVATPGYGGRYWAIETYRRRPDAEAGVIPCMMLQIARQFQEEGVQVMSLCQVPGLRADQTEHADSRFVRNSLVLWWHWMTSLYDPARLYHFKSRFRPDYREVFLAGVKPKFVPMLAFALKWGVVWPDFRKLPRQMARRMKKWGHTEQLACPLKEKYRLVNDLQLDDLPAPQIAKPVIVAEAKPAKLSKTTAETL